MRRRPPIGLIALALAGLVPATASAQTYGLTRAPSPPRRAQPWSPGRQDAYDRADRGWQQERRECLGGANRSRSAARSCNDIQRTREPLPSDYLRIPSAR